jgi:enamine deaminase RidA (YjgF/YER057c/UK114 family)
MRIDRIRPGSRLSQAVIHRDTIYIAGHVADDPSTGVADQTRQILAKIDALLAEVGSDKSKMLSATVWLANAGSYDEMNTVWDAWVAAGAPPARACVESKLAGPDYQVEISAIAARGQG